MKQELPGMVPRVLGVLVALSRGQLSQEAVEASFDPATIMEVPALPAGYVCLGCPFMARYEQKNEVSLTGDGPSATQTQKDCIQDMTVRNRAFIARREGAGGTLRAWAGHLEIVNAS